MNSFILPVPDNSALPYYVFALIVVFSVRFRLKSEAKKNAGTGFKMKRKSLFYFFLFAADIFFMVIVIQLIRWYQGYSAHS
jgi:hypothetical protein